MPDEEKLSNTEIKNFIEHSFKIIISSFSDRLEKIEKRLSDIESNLGSFSDTRKQINSSQHSDSKEPKDTDSDLSDALKLIGTE